MGTYAGEVCRHFENLESQVQRAILRSRHFVVPKPFHTSNDKTQERECHSDYFKHDNKYFAFANRPPLDGVDAGGIIFAQPHPKTISLFQNVWASGSKTPLYGAL